MNYDVEHIYEAMLSTFIRGFMHPATQRLTLLPTDHNEVEIAFPIVILAIFISLTYSQLQININTITT